MDTPPEKQSRPIRAARQIVKEISDALKGEKIIIQVREGTEKEIKISEVVVGGSMGQGTIVHGKYDIDLVVLSTSLDPTKLEALTHSVYKMSLEKIEERLQAIQGSNAPRDINNLLYGWKFRAGHLNVDLQLTYKWDKLEDLVSYLDSQCPEKKRILFSCGAVKTINQLFKNLPQRVTRLIVRFKMWRDKTWAESDTSGRPKSYLISMLVIIAYSRASKELRHTRKLKKLASWVTDEIKDIVEKEILQKTDDLDLQVIEALEKIWSPPGPDAFTTCQQIMRAYKEKLPKKPRIIDPVNPFNNLYKNRGLGPIKPPVADSSAARWRLFAAMMDKKEDGLDLTKDTGDTTILGRHFEFGTYK